MNQHVATAIAKYEAAGIQFSEIFNWHLCYGIVISDAYCFAMAFPADSCNPQQCVEPHHADTLFVTFATGDMRHGLAPYRDKFDHIAFQRSFKNSDKLRLLDMQSFYSKLR